MKKIIVLLFVVSLAGCLKKLPAPEKPFVIVYKFINAANCNRCAGEERRCTMYKYKDNNNNIHEFCDYADMYYIGDTIH